MRIAIVSDIHGNRRAFDAVLADLRDVAPDLIVHGGDLSSGGAHPVEIIDQIQSLGWPGVSGNTDEMLWAPNRITEFAATLPQLSAVFQRVQDTIPWTVDKLGVDRLGWLEKLPAMILRFSMDGTTNPNASGGFGKSPRRHVRFTVAADA